MGSPRLPTVSPFPTLNLQLQVVSWASQPKEKSLLITLPTEMEGGVVHNDLRAKEIIPGLSQNLNSNQVTKAHLLKC